jgi:hypothetical protein
MQTGYVARQATDGDDADVRKGAGGRHVGFGNTVGGEEGVNDDDEREYHGSMRGDHEAQNIRVQRKDTAVDIKKLRKDMDDVDEDEARDADDAFAINQKTSRSFEDQFDLPDYERSRRPNGSTSTFQSAKFRDSEVRAAEGGAIQSQEPAHLRGSAPARKNSNEMTWEERRREKKLTSRDTTDNVGGDTTEGERTAAD